MSNFKIQFTKDEFAELAESILSIVDGGSNSEAIVFGDPRTGESIVFELVDKLSDEELADLAKIKELEAQLPVDRVEMIRQVAVVFEQPYTELLKACVEKTNQDSANATQA